MTAASNARAPSTREHAPTKRSHNCCTMPIAAHLARCHCKHSNACEPCCFVTAQRICDPLTCFQQSQAWRFQSTSRKTRAKLRWIEVLHTQLIQETRRHHRPTVFSRHTGYSAISGIAVAGPVRRNLNSVSARLDTNENTHHDNKFLLGGKGGWGAGGEKLYAHAPGAFGCSTRPKRSSSW
jgi:hypothetical protein